MAERIYQLASDHLLYLDKYIQFLLNEQELSSSSLLPIIENHLKPLLQFVAMRHKIFVELPKLRIDDKEIWHAIYSFLFIKKETLFNGTNVYTDVMNQLYPFPEYVDTYLELSVVDNCLMNFILRERNLFLFADENQDVFKELINSIIESAIIRGTITDIILSNAHIDNKWSKYLIPYLQRTANDSILKRIHILSRNYYGITFRKLLSYTQNPLFDTLLCEEYKRAILKSKILIEERNKIKDIWKQYLKEKLQQIHQLQLELQVHIYKSGSFELAKNRLKIEQVVASTKALVQKEIEYYHSILNHCNTIILSISTKVKESLAYMLEILMLSKSSQIDLSRYNHSKLTLWVLNKQALNKILTFCKQLYNEDENLFRSAINCLILIIGLNIQQMVIFAKRSILERAKTSNVNFQPENEWIINLIERIQRLYDRMSVIPSNLDIKWLEKNLSYLLLSIRNACRYCFQITKDKISIEKYDTVLCHLYRSYQGIENDLLSNIKSIALIQCCLIYLPKQKEAQKLAFRVMHKMVQYFQELSYFYQTSQFQYIRLQQLTQSTFNSFEKFIKDSFFLSHLNSLKHIRLDLMLLSSQFTKIDPTVSVIIDIDRLMQWLHIEKLIRILEGPNFNRKSTSDQLVRVGMFLAYKFDLCFENIDSVHYQTAYNYALQLIPTDNELRFRHLINIIQDRMKISGSSELEGKTRHTFFSNHDWLAQLVKETTVSSLWKKLLSENVLEWIVVEQLLYIEGKLHQNKTRKEENIELGITQKSLLHSMLHKSKQIAQLLISSINEQIVVKDTYVFYFCFELLPWLIIQRGHLFEACLLKQLLSRSYPQSNKQIDFIFHMLQQINKQTGDSLDWINDMEAKIKSHSIEEMALMTATMQNMLQEKDIMKTTIVKELKLQILKIVRNGYL